MHGYLTDIEKTTIANGNFREVLYTTPQSQLVVMSIEPGEDIGKEVHQVDQFIRIEQGDGELELDGEKSPVHDGSAFVIPAGTRHDVTNTGKRPMKLYTIYAPPEHRDGTVHRTKDDAERDEADHPAVAEPATR